MKLPVDALLDLTGQVALVTGASGGIGRGIAARLAEAGAAVAVHYGQNEEAAQEVVRETQSAGGKAQAVQTDLTDPVAVEALFSNIEAGLGPVTLLINNAGLQPVAPLGDISSDEWAAVLDVNLKAAHLLGTELSRRASPGGASGSIVNIASIEGINPADGHGHYSASKAALLMLTRSQALEFGPKGLRANSVSPGLISRDGIEEDWPEGVARWQAAAPLTRLGEPQDIADAVLFLASPAARWITGANLVVDGGVTARSTW
jgi:NAD(P)-dependent dehydrogenase (short-subunit alcohol dehydrogenase family)